MATLNKQSLYLRFRRTYGKQLKRDIDASIKEKFEDAKADLLREIRDDPISVEISDGPEASPSSGVVSRGNLFSFIGFRKSRKPIEELLDLIEENVVLKPSILSSRSKYIFEYVQQIQYPKMSAIENHPKLSYDVWNGPGGSWIYGIRNGVSGFTNYVYSTTAKFKNSRSGPAIQKSKGPELGGEHSPQEGYISDQIGNFEDAINDMDLEDINLTIR